MNNQRTTQYGTPRRPVIAGRYALALGLLATCLLQTSTLWGQDLEEAPPADTAPLDLLEGVEAPPSEEQPPAPETPPAEPLNSIEDIALQMQQVESRLRNTDSGSATQTMQQEIIAALDAVIEDMRKSGAGQSNNSQPNASQSSGGEPRGSQDEPQDPAQQEGETPSDNEQEQQGEEQERDPNDAIDESTERGGHEPGEGPVLESRPSLLRQAWGHLPGHAAEAMPNAATEQFLPEYQREIELYFRSLNEEQPSDSL